MSGEITSLLNNQLIQFTVHKLQGSGDLSCGSKLVRQLHEKGGIPLEQMVIATNDPEGMRKFIGKMPIRIEPLYVPNKSNVNSFFAERTINEISNVALQIVIPASHPSEVRVHVQRAVKTLVLYEYGYSAEQLSFLPKTMFQAYSLGLNEKAGELGIFIDPDWKEKHELSKEENRLKRLMLLKEVSPNIQEMILGSSREEALDSLITEFSQTSLLFTGYGEFQFHYFRSICERSPKDKHLVMILPNYSEKKGSNYEALQELRTEYQFNLVIYKEGKKREFPLPDGKGVRTVICCLDSPDYENFERLSVASEPEVLRTGDQSFGEAVSQNKRFVYAVDSHKETFGQNIEALFGDIRPVIIKNSKKASEAFSIKSSLSSTMLLIYSDENSATFSQRNRAFCWLKNCYPKIEKIIQEMLITPVERPFVSLADEKEFFIEKLSMDTGYLIKLEQFIELKLMNNRSTLPGYEDSLFDTELLSGNVYYIKRIK